MGSEEKLKREDEEREEERLLLVREDEREEEREEELEEREEDTEEERDDVDEEDPHAFTVVTVLVMRVVFPEGEYFGSTVVVILVPTGQVLFVNTRNDAIVAL